MARLLPLLPLCSTLWLFSQPQPSPAQVETSPSGPDRFLHWGDQGDGTYANPVLNGDFADADVERAGDRWVMITSTNHLSPGMTILESTDLVNWRYLGHAIPSLDWQPRYDWRAMDGYRHGVWAGDLVYHEGREAWLCYFIDFRSGLYVTRAKELTGPWSKAACLLKRKHWTDPTVFFDRETKEAWMLVNGGRGSPPQRDRPHELELFRLSWDGGELLDEGKTIWSGHRVEAAKLRRFDGRWYVMFIEWQGRGERRDRKQLCLRSTTDSIYGPYESRTVMERAANDHRSACQGSLIEAPDGRWWFLHQLVQNGEPVFHGRPQCLQPVSWVDGWPIPGRDIDGDGIGEPVWRHPKPVESESSLRLQTSDEFDGETIGPQWNWNHDPRTERFSLAANPGRLRLIASKPVVADRARLEAPFWGAPNTLSQRQLGIGETRVEAKLELEGLEPGTRAGICHFSGAFRGYGGQFAVFGVREEADGRRVIFFADPGGVETGPEIANDAVYLRSDTDFDRATFAWSLDGETWRESGYRYTLRFGNWRGNRPGLCCWNGRTDARQEVGHVDVDWFRYRPSEQAPE